MVDVFLFEGRFAINNLQTKGFVTASFQNTDSSFGCRTFHLHSTIDGLFYLIRDKDLSEIKEHIFNISPTRERRWSNLSGVI
jgi:hypothetical protein